MALTKGQRQLPANEAGGTQHQLTTLQSRFQGRAKGTAPRWRCPSTAQPDVGSARAWLRDSKCAGQMWGCAWGLRRWGWLKGAAAGMFLWVTHEASTRGCNILTGGEIMIINDNQSERFTLHCQACPWCFPNTSSRSVPGDTEASMASRQHSLLPDRGNPTCRGRSRPVSIPKVEDAQGAWRCLLAQAILAALP